MNPSRNLGISIPASSAPRRGGKGGRWRPAWVTVSWFGGWRWPWQQSTLLGVVCLILFFVVGGPFGSINDVANAAVDVLSAVLAYPIWCFRLARTQRLGDDVRL